MELLEIRDLDGPNMFLPVPAVKLEFGAVGAGDASAAAGRLAAAFALRAASGRDPLRSLGAMLIAAVEEFHARCGLPAPRTLWTAMDTPGSHALAFSWTRRAFALRLAEGLARSALVGGGDVAEMEAELRRRLADDDPEDRPLWITDDRRRARIVAVTGTNGKTTTTRLIAHILREAGHHVGWSSSSGVYIDGEEVIVGDYSGPSGARRVLQDGRVEIAVLETARGGILLRGLAYESNDVSVFTNISADHLDLQGVRTVETLARVKATVVAVTREEGWMVLNADDDHVLAATASAKARRLLFSIRDDNPLVRAHAKVGGSAAFVESGAFIAMHVGHRDELLPVAEAPVTMGGRAGHMTENALAAIGATLALGLPPEQIRNGLRSFRNSTGQNSGRLNLFEVDGATVVVDFAHNEAGLARLLELSRRLAAEGGRVVAIIGTAGDRTDASLRAIGRIAAERSDFVIVKQTAKYLRGRTNEQIDALYLAGIGDGGGTRHEVCADELSAMELAVADAKPGDVIAIMCHEQVDEVLALLRTIGTPRD